MTRFSCLTLAVVCVASTPSLPTIAIGAPSGFTPGGFSFEHQVMVPGKPEMIYDALTGDISGWWDHTFSSSPKALIIEPKVGGGFYERFDDQGNGVRHAEVTWAERGKQLRLVGPLGFAGAAVALVSTLTLEAAGDSTRIKLACHASGEIQSGWPEACEGVWRHFLVERFKPYIEAGRSLKRKPLKPAAPLLGSAAIRRWRGAHAGTLDIHHQAHPDPGPRHSGPPG